MQISTCNTQHDATCCTTLRGNDATSATHPFRGVAVLQAGGVALSLNSRNFASTATCDFLQGTGNEARGCCAPANKESGPIARARDDQFDNDSTGNDTP